MRKVDGTKALLFFGLGIATIGTNICNTVCSFNAIRLVITLAVTAILGRKTISAGVFYYNWHDRPAKDLESALARYEQGKNP